MMGQGGSRILIWWGGGVKKIILLSHITSGKSEVDLTPHSKNCGVKITPPVLIKDHTMHFTPVLNLWC